MGIVVVGTTFVDVKGHPLGKYVPKGRNAGRVIEVHGGVARNIAHNLRLLGQEVRLMSVFGGDNFAKELIEDCTKIGMDLSLSDQFKEELSQQAEEMVRRNLALEAWGRHIDIEITDAMIASNFKRSGVPFPELEEAQWRANGRITELRAAIRRAGALRDIMQSLQVETVEIEAH